MKYLFMVWIGIAAMMNSLALAQENLVIAQPFAYAKGDQWLYKVKDLIRDVDIEGYTNVVTEVMDGKAWLMMQSKGKAWEVFDNGLGRVIERHAYDENFDNRRGRLIESYSQGPNGADVQFPLEVGREYNVEYERDITINEYRNGFLSSQRREPAKTTMTAKIEGIEKVMTKMGEFDAYKIHLRGRLNQYHLSETPQIEKIIWWSPVVKREVMIEFKQWDSRPQEATAAGLSRIGHPSIHTRTELLDFRLGPTLVK